MPSPRPSRFAPYKSALEALSVRTKTPLPSLVASFAILHELTAIVPLVSVFFCARALGVGEQAVVFVRKGIAEESTNRSWMQEKGAEWINEGEQWAARVGRRYGLFGYTKGPKLEYESDRSSGRDLSRNIAGDVANAVLAYGVTKALIPARIGLSIYLAPAFSRRIVEPLRVRIMHVWRR